MAHSLRAVIAATMVVLPTSAREGTLSAPPAHVSTYEPEPVATAIFLDSPASISVNSTSDSQIALSWTAVSGAVSYRVERSPNLLTPYSSIGEPATNSFQDAGVSRGNTYLYRVRAIDSTGTVSSPSAVAMATAITFLDLELIGANDSQGRPATTVKAAHVNDLRTAVAGVRRAALLPTATWQETVSLGVPVKAAHVQELRTKLDEALAALGLPVAAYTDATLSTGSGGTRVKKVHFDELRSRSTRGTGVSGSGLAAYDFASARLDASNSTGSPGVDLVSRNFNWSLPLVSLPGRVGLDLGLSLTYNSLVWTKSGGYVLFDGDGGWPAPGFRLGFPVVQGKFYDAQAQKYAYMLVTPSGARVSLRQTATAGVYEAGDSSYLQLTEEADGGLTLRASDGTRMSYWPHGGVYKCTEVKDRSSNFITVAYDIYDNVRTVTDTLGRAVNFGYYPDGYLKEITQTWHREVEGGSTAAETHYWARFYYADKVVRTNFVGLTVFGPSNGQTIRALTKVKLSDDSSFTFNYTTWGQINQVAGYAPDGRLLNYTSLDMPLDEMTAQSDCPRPTGRRDWAAYWNGDSDGAGAASEEAATTYGTYNFAGGVAKATAPDATVHQETYETTGWKKGLVTRADEFSADDHVHPKKWTVMTWTQDDEALTYKQNPRVTETNVYDSNDDGSVRDRRRTEVVYTSFGLPQDVKEYDSDATTMLRRTHMEYVPDSINANGAYTARRIIGLPQKREVYGPEGGQEKLFSKVTFEYDLANTGSTHYLEDAGAVAQHDGSYGASFTTRGNLCRMRRWDAGYPDEQSKSVASEAGYNTLGSALFTSDALGHKTTISYADSDNGARLAYPTKVTDPDSFYSTIEYNYDTGAVTRAVDPKGAAAKTYYDAAGRVLKSVSEANGAYAGFEYGASGLYVKRLTKVDTDKTETFVMSVADGAGRAVGVLRDHPGTGTTGYAASRTEYDVMGRAVRQYNPAEVSVDAADKSNARAWVPAGDDANPQGREGWAHTSTVYDWKGRTKSTTNADGTSAEADYGGCGCAGRETVTTTDEGTLSADGTLRRRKSRKTADALGRPTKEESFNWDGTIYSTAVTEYNALDQVAKAKVYQGAAAGDGSCPVATCQLTTRNYDGHGRLKSSQAPAQTRAVTYQYNTDDTLWKVITPREPDGGSSQDVTATFTYNSRHLVRRVEYSVPAGLTNVPATGPVEYDYDAAGNRLWMTDDSGRTDYQYDTLSHLQSETRQFAELAGSYTLSYSYNLAGELTGVTQDGATIEYKYDRTGRIEEVNGQGTLYGGVSSYANTMRYRAWGALKSMSYGNGLNFSAEYNSRLLPEEFNVTGTLGTGTVEATSKQYRYHPDGSLFFSDDLRDDNFDRLTTYDQVGRLASASAGQTVSTAMNGTPGNSTSNPYAQTYGYDAWSNLTRRDGVYWNHSDEPEAYTASYDSRNRQTGIPYDAAGNPLQGPEGSYKFDAAGYNLELLVADFRYVHTRDGDGVVAKREELRPYPLSPVTTYYLKSSVLGGRIVEEISATGSKQKGYVYAGSELLAEQEYGAVRWWVNDPHGGSSQKWGQGFQMEEVGELDPTGVNVGASDPFANASGDTDPLEGVSVLPDSPSGRCTVDGVAFFCARLGDMLAIGWAGIDTITTVTIRNHGRLIESYSGRLGLPVGFGATFTGAAGGIAAAAFHEYQEDGFRAAAFMTVIWGRIASGRTLDTGDGGAMGGALFFAPQRDVTPVMNKIRWITGDYALGKPELKSKLEVRIMLLLTKPCAEAFKTAGLSTPEEIINKGLTIAARPFLDDPGNNDTFGISADIQKEASKSTAPELTIGPQFTSKGAIIFFRADVFTDQVYLDEVVAHAFIHAAGIQKRPLWGYSLGRGHDLSGYEHYEDIIKQCGAAGVFEEGS